ncbi:hypothetical protein K439DRAFT_1610451 [Ramaria rubella]|nr:hypothetical protein K439DRAFT_1610451 [Ramaria rubella]
MHCKAALKNSAASGPIDLFSLNSSYPAAFLLYATYTIMVGRLLYDYFLTLGLEIKFVWSSKWSLAKALCFATTYVNLMNMVVSVPGMFGVCSSIPRLFATLEVCGSLITIWTAEYWSLSPPLNERLNNSIPAVHLFRTWVIWKRNKNMAIGLLGLLAFVAISSTTFMVLGIRAEASSQLVVGSITFFSFVLLAFYELVMLGLIIYKAKQHSSFFSEMSDPRRLANYFGFCGKRILHISALNVTLHSVFTKRLFLNLRSVASEDEGSAQRWAPNNTFMAVPGLQFALTSDTSI